MPKRRASAGRAAAPKRTASAARRAASAAAIQPIEDRSVQAAVARIEVLEGGMLPQLQAMVGSALQWAGLSAASSDASGGGDAAVEGQRVLRGHYAPADELFYNDPPEEPHRVDASTTDKSFLGAVLGGRWEVRSAIHSGAVGRGWIALDRRDRRQVFVKTFRSPADSDHPNSANENVQKEIRGTYYKDPAVNS